MLVPLQPRMARIHADFSLHRREWMRRWLERWKVVGPLLEQERSARIAALDDDRAWAESQGLLAMWEPWMTGDAGAGLLPLQALLTRWQGRRRT